MLTAAPAHRPPPTAAACPRQCGKRSARTISECGAPPIVIRAVRPRAARPVAAAAHGAALRVLAAQVPSPCDCPALETERDHASSEQSAIVCLAVCLAASSPRSCCAARRRSVGC
eukprot:Tamp_40694.p1 GENE.Tamp_40694~~Tamp_40694.p1  ORF type:complete len:130 (-),score=6.45 Tamp_40694:56-400(-)